MHFELGTSVTGHKQLMVSFLPPETTEKVEIILLSNQQQILPLLFPPEDGNRSIFRNTMGLSLLDDRQCPHLQSSPLEPHKTMISEHISCTVTHQPFFYLWDQTLPLVYLQRLPGRWSGTGWAGNTKSISSPFVDKGRLKVFFWISGGGDFAKKSSGIT